MLLLTNFLLEILVLKPKNFVEDILILKYLKWPPSFNGLSDFAHLRTRWRFWAKKHVWKYSLKLIQAFEHMSHMHTNEHIFRYPRVRRYCTLCSLIQLVTYFNDVNNLLTNFIRELNYAVFVNSIFKPIKYSEHSYLNTHF